MCVNLIYYLTTLLVAINHKIKFYKVNLILLQNYLYGHLLIGLFIDKNYADF